MRLGALAGVFDFFIPAEVLSAVLLVFTLENVLDYAFSAFIPAELEVVGWVTVYVIGTTSISILNYATADEDERDDLEDDIEDLT